MLTLTLRCDPGAHGVDFTRNGKLEMKTESISFGNPFKHTTSCQLFSIKLNRFHFSPLKTSLLEAPTRLFTSLSRDIRRLDEN